MKIVILGSGNMAHYCCTQLVAQHEFKLVQLYARNSIEGNILAKRFDTPIVNDLSAIIQNADIYIFAVADAAINQIANNFFKTEALLIHCAGSQPTTILENAGKNNGIIWPIYSIQKDQSTYPSDVPLVVDANNESARTSTELLAKSMSQNVTLLNHAQRKYMHLNAVLVNNFNNHLMAIAEQICKVENIDFNILLPIINQTAKRIELSSPSQSQTGPAKRGDWTTMQQQMDLLATHPEWQKVYESLSVSIKKMYDK